jgi:hypothetical protein
MPSGTSACTAVIDGGADEGNPLAFLDGRTISMAQPHTAKAEARDLQTALS